jgi:LPXTG-motif cell wall-anchored protein
MRQAARLILGAVAVLAMIGGFGLQAASAQNQDDDPRLFETGKAVFEGTCVGCHSVDGSGSATGRSLIGIAAEQPDRLVSVAKVTNGTPTGMPAFGEEISAEDIDAAVTYVRLAFLDELPRTGSSSSLIVIGGSLFLVGLTFLASSRGLYRRATIGLVA